MKHRFIFLSLALSLSLGASYSLAQVTTSRSGNETHSQDVVRAQEAVNEVLVKSGIAFKEGLIAFADNNREVANQKFNESVEVFLYSTLNIQREQKLRVCYNQLIETIYRIEFPFKTQNPQIAALASSCDWKVDDQLAEKITKLTFQIANREYNITDVEARFILEKEETAKKKVDLARLSMEEAKSRLMAILEREKSLPASDVETAKARTEYDQAVNNYYDASTAQAKLSKLSAIGRDKSTVGFETQQFQPSPLDELSKLTLTPDELDLEGREILPKHLNDTLIGPKPSQSKDGKVGAVMSYFNATLHDPYSMKFVSWSSVAKIAYGSSSYWGVTVRYRAKNALGAYVLAEITFYIRNNKVVTPSIVINPPTAYFRTKVGNLRIVKAKAGDTVTKLAERYNATPTEVAKFNGLLPNSLLGAGREIKLPPK